MANNSVVVKFLADTSQMRKSMGEIEGSLNKFGKAVKGIGIALAGAFVVDKIADFGKEAINIASDLEEAASKTNAVFGEQAGVIEEASKRAAKAAGLSEGAYLSAASTLGIYADKAGLAGAAQAEFATGLSQAAADFASFYNTDVDSALSAIQQGLRGESEALRKYGVFLDDATLKQGYFNATGEEVVGTLTAQQKIIGAQNQIYEQGNVALGDYARTSDGLANTQRTLAATFENLKGALGEGLLPVVSELASVLIPIVEDLTPTFAELGRSIGEALGPALTELSAVVAPLGKALGSVAGVMGGVLTSVIKSLAPIVVKLATNFGQFVERVAPTLLPFIEKLGGLLGKLLDALMPVVDVALDLAATLIEALAPILEVVIDVLVILVDAIAPVITALGSIIKALSPVIAAFGQLLGDILTPLIPVLTIQAKLIGVVLTKALGYVAIALGHGIKAWASFGKSLIGIVGPIVEKVLGFLADLAEGASFFDFLGFSFGDIAAGLRSSSQTITSSLNSFVDSYAAAGDKVIGVGNDILDGTNALAEDTQFAYTDLLAPTDKTTEKAKGKMEKAGKSTIEAAGKGAAKGKEKAKSSLIDSVNSVLEAGSKVFEDWRNKVVGWMDLGKAFDIANDSKARLADLNEQLGDLRAKPEFDKDAEAKLLEEIDKAAAEAGKTWADRFAEQISSGVEFSKQLGDLKNSGLNDTLLQQIASMGPENGAKLATELLTGDRGMIDTLNAQSATITKAGEDLGVLMANEGPAAGNKYGINFIGDPKGGGLLFTINKNKKKVKKAIREALNTEVEVKVRYVPDTSALANAPGGSGRSVVSEIQSYEALNGTRWRL